VNGTIGPQQPLLFYLDGLDMRWRSLATVAEQVEAGRRALTALDLPAGATVSFRWRAGPEAVTADLAIRAGGWTALPLVGEAAEPGEIAGSADGTTSASRGAPRPAARLLLPGEPVPGSGPEDTSSAPEDSAGPIPVARLPVAATELSAHRDRGVLEVPLPELDALPGGALVHAGDASAVPPVRSSWRVLTPAEITERVARLAVSLTDRRADHGASRLWSGRRRRPGRPVVVACLDPSTPGGRTTLDWALAARAALYLEPDAWALGGISAWCRPTLVAGDGPALASVAAEIRRRSARSARISTRISAWTSTWISTWTSAGRRRLGRALRKLGGRGEPPARSPRPPRPPRPPLGRLRTAILLEGAAGGTRGRLGAEDLALFARHGVALVTPET